VCRTVSKALLKSNAIKFFECADIMFNTCFSCLSILFKCSEDDQAASTLRTTRRSLPIFPWDTVTIFLASAVVCLLLYNIRPCAVSTAAAATVIITRRALGGAHVPRTKSKIRKLGKFDAP